MMHKYDVELVEGIVSVYHLLTFQYLNYYSSKVLTYSIAIHTHILYHIMIRVVVLHFNTVGTLLSSQ